MSDKKNNPKHIPYTIDEHAVFSTLVLEAVIFSLPKSTRDLIRLNLEELTKSIPDWAEDRFQMMESFDSSWSDTVVTLLESYIEKLEALKKDP